MEERRWVESEWGTSDKGKRAKFYRITTARPTSAEDRDRKLEPYVTAVAGVMAVPRSSQQFGRWRCLTGTMSHSKLAPVPHVLAARRRARRRRRAALPPRGAHRRPRRVGPHARRRRPQARAEFGDVDQVSAGLRDIDQRILDHRARTEWRTVMKDEIRHALRRLARHPAFTVPAVLTLALGLGATTAIYTVLDAVVLRPLPFANADRLVYIDSPMPGMGADTRWWLGRHEMFYFKAEHARAGGPRALPARRGDRARRRRRARGARQRGERQRDAHRRARRSRRSPADCSPPRTTSRRAGRRRPPRLRLLGASLRRRPEHRRQDHPHRGVSAARSSACCSRREPA